MKTTLETELDHLLEEYNLRKEQYTSVYQQYLSEINDGAKIILKKSADNYLSKAKELEKKITELRASLEFGWQNRLFRIDFDQAEEALRPVIRHYRRSGKVAMLVLQESSQMMGEYCVLRLKDGWMSSVNKTVAH